MFATTADIVKAAGITSQVVADWVRYGYLPAPTRISLGPHGGMCNRFPSWAVERARFVAQRRQAGYSRDEILAMLAELDKRQAAPSTVAAPRKGKAGRGGK
ncbi:hypothetical protein [Nannocystis pusilla]|uniref:MerR family transcriptional regulator n=1 Tax=Nannocystis pusilla TaxID=889268 RepID=A0ABS7TYA8_9BACT|nr:hypothetical protein [Nannocystis pusilla]MBZ5713011.1 hypothetical protein [Nannocystis pusilla]